MLRARKYFLMGSLLLLVAGCRPSADNQGAPSLATPADGAGRESTWLAPLEKLLPHVPWDHRSAVIADLDGDAKVDRAVTGRVGDTLFLGIVHSQAAADFGATYFDIPITAGVQFAVCPGQFRLEIEHLLRDPQAPVAVELGLTELASSLQRLPSETQGLRIASEDCDGLHFFWDPHRGEFGWWRL